MSRLQSRGFCSPSRHHLRRLRPPAYGHPKGNPPPASPIDPVVWAQPHISPYIQVHTEAERIPVIYKQNNNRRLALAYGPPRKPKATDQRATTSSETELRRSAEVDRTRWDTAEAVLLSGLTARQASPSDDKRGGRLNLCSRRRCVESLSYTASEVVGRDGSSPEPNRARRPTSGVAEVQLLEGIVSRRLVASGYPPKMLP
jgi:hypothetical protein